MKLTTRMIALTLTMLPLLAAAQMSTGQKIVTNIPFEFVVGNKIVPAGEYSVKLTDSGMGLAVMNPNAKVGLYSSFVIDESKKAAGNCELVFHRYGNRSFLTGVRLEGSSIVYRLPESKGEAELQARNAPSVEKTLLASRR
jgi:hypothetical protein